MHLKNYSLANPTYESCILREKCHNSTKSVLHASYLNSTKTRPKVSLQQNINNVPQKSTSSKNTINWRPEYAPLFTCSSWSPTTTTPEGHSDDLPPSPIPRSRILLLIQPHLHAPILKQTRLWNGVVLEGGDVDAGATGLTWEKWCVNWCCVLKARRENGGAGRARR